MLQMRYNRKRNWATTLKNEDGPWRGAAEGTAHVSEDVFIYDDSPWLQARGFWNDTGVSSHTNRSVQPHERDMLKATHVLVGTADKNGRVFTHGPTPWNPPKRD